MDLDLPLNHNAPTVLHVDMNACFARAEQQARPLLRNKAVGVAAYTTPGGCVVSPSVEAKRAGVKTAMTVRDSRLLAPDITILPSDPEKYREVHRRFCAIFREYSPDVAPKSIDEAVIDFAGTAVLKARSMEQIGQELKTRVRRDIGSWMRCNVGIGTNRFLAKLAAGLHKPDGLDTITHENLEDVYSQLTLLDLPGINERFQARLHAVGITTPLQFLAAPREQLIAQVFRSINGHYWYLRLRGWEIDAVPSEQRSIGHAYSLHQQTADPAHLSRLLLKLCEKTGRRLRRAGMAARGVHVSLVYTDRTYWHQGRRFSQTLYTTQEIHIIALLLLNRQPAWKRVKTLAVSVYDLEAGQHEQASLFETDVDKRRRLSDALDTINDRWGEYVITPALMLGMEGTAIDRISFGGIREIETVYADEAASAARAAAGGEQGEDQHFWDR